MLSKTVIVALGAVSLALAAPTLAQEPGGHEGHTMAPAPTTGSWSYADRDNPRIHTRERWHVVPEPGSANTFLSAKDLSLRERCAALLVAENVALDRAMRAACGEPAQETSPGPSEGDAQGDMGHSEHHQNH